MNIFNDQPLIALFNLTWRYLAVAGFYYLFFYVWRNKNYWYHKIQERYPKKSDIRREILYSVCTILIFGLVIIGIVIASRNGLTKNYPNISDRGIAYYIFSILLMIVVHDTYFYWTHRLMHWKPLFKLAHKVHHLSTNPTPFAAYAFHPLEAFVEIGILPLIAFTLPYHRSALIIFSLYSLILNVSGHLGFELFPKGFASHKLFKWHNTSTHHNMHHRLVKCNYGLYLNFWDRIMGTNHPDYEKSFDAVAERRDEADIKKENLSEAIQ